MKRDLDGLLAIKGKVKLPKIADVHSVPTFAASAVANTPYIYTGGWGRLVLDPPPNNGQPVGNIPPPPSCDLGLQYSPKRHVWNLFTLGGINPHTYFLNNQVNFSPEELIELEQVLTNNGNPNDPTGGFKLKLTRLTPGTAGITPGSNYVVGAVWNNVNALIWFPSDGKGVVFKRNTSIAFPSENGTVVSTNQTGKRYYWGGPNPSYLCNVTWSDWMARQDIGGAPIWIELAIESTVSAVTNGKPDSTLLLFWPGFFVPTTVSTTIRSTFPLSPYTTETVGILMNAP
jgi:hypothetical protein